jgi:hypothetical protein
MRHELISVSDIPESGDRHGGVAGEEGHDICTGNHVPTSTYVCTMGVRSFWRETVSSVNGTVPNTTPVRARRCQDLSGPMPD